MSLRTLDLPLLLKPSDQDLFRDFFVPALTHAFRYDRGVGYFASGWLRLAAQGMVFRRSGSVLQSLGWCLARQRMKWRKVQRNWYCMKSNGCSIRIAHDSWSTKCRPDMVQSSQRNSDSMPLRARRGGL